MCQLPVSPTELLCPERNTYQESPTRKNGDKVSGG